MPTETRERILQAAFSVLSRNGYENTSVKDIAEEAGVAQGLVHYYFKSKEQLVLAVLQMTCEQMKLQRHGIEGEANALAAFEHFKASLREHRDFQSLYVELIGVGLHEPEIGAGVLEFVRSDRAYVEAIARQVLAEREDDPRRAPAMAGAVEAAILGIIVQNLVDPDFDADAAVDALAAMSLASVAG